MGRLFVRGAVTVMGVWLLFWLLLCSAAGALPIGEFYPHGPNVDTHLSKLEDVSSSEIKLITPINFYGETYDSIFVNDNGILSFLTDIPAFINVQFPLDYPVIAPLYLNIDIRKSGDVYYRETQDSNLIEKFSSKIQQLYPDTAESFIPRSLFIVTYLNVGYFKETVDEVNTFQVVIGTEGETTFVQFLYKDGGIQWIQGEYKGGALPDAKAQVGFVSIDRRMYLLQGSGTDQIKNLDKLTNSNEPGLFTFRVGKFLTEFEDVEPPSETNDLDSSELLSCASSSTKCHSQATCIDNNSTGFCCICREQYYGNGRTCLKEQIPLRINGKVNLNINGLKFSDVDLQAYIVTNDSRSYVAFSNVPGELGPSLQLLILFSSVIGWLFAKPIDGAPNGYQLTGGFLNNTMDLTFTKTNQHLRIRQNYLGLDVFDQLKVEVEINGQMPTLLYTNVSMPDFSQQFTKTGPGSIRSHSTHTIYEDQSQLEYPLTLDQFIDYSEYCPQENVVLRLKAARNFISYDKEHILRFASSTKISKVLESEDPCIENHASCVANSTCVSEGNSFKCVCNAGFKTEDYGCVDINECNEGISTCDVQNAICINEIGSYSCQCKPGFSGNGYSCIENIPEDPCQLDPSLCDPIPEEPGLTCDPPNNKSNCYCELGYQKIIVDDEVHCKDIDECLEGIITECHPDADCKNLEGSYTCNCKPGFFGDGYGDCQVMTNCEFLACGDNAECVKDDYEGAKCVCTEDFDGDGFFCKRKPIIGCDNCSPFAKCVNSKCICKPGFIGDGIYCTHSEPNTAYKTCMDGKCWCPEGFFERPDSIFCFKEEEFSSCDSCHENALCEYTDDFKYQCKCKPGFLGNGFDCVKEIKQQECQCHPNADCIANIEVDHRMECHCKTGYEGDGVTNCEPIVVTPSPPADCRQLDNCSPEAACVFNSTILGFQCECIPGFEGDGFLCHPVDNCLNNVNLCHENAICEQTGHTFTCKCKEGYFGNGKKCKEILQRTNEFLLVNQGMAMFRIPYNPTQYDSGYLIQLKSDQNAIGITVDCLEDRVYWSDILSKQIISSLYNGTKKEVFISDGIGSVEGLAVDWIHRMIYWTDSLHDTIMAANLESKEKKVIISTGLENPRGIVVDPHRSKIYWSDWKRDDPKIEVANLDGTNRAVLLKSPDVQLPNSLAIDWSKEALCWADAGTKSIECISFSYPEYGKETVVTNCFYPFGLAISTDKYYWTDWHTNKVESAWKVSRDRGQSIDPPLGGSGKLYGITTATEQRCPA